MAAFTTMALVGASVLGSAMGAVQQRNARKAQEKQIKEQEEQARIDAANAAALAEGELDEGAEVVLGRGRASTKTGALSTSQGTSTRSGAVSSRVGGLKRRPSSGVGL